MDDNMTIEELKDMTPGGYAKEEYLMSSNFEQTTKENFIYPDTFKEQDVYLLRTPRCYFLVSVREKLGKKLLRPLTKGDMVRAKPFQVMMAGAFSGTPLPLTLWEEFGDPWRMGVSMYIDSFYFGRKYKYDFQYDEGEVPVEGRTSSAFNRHFDTKEEAVSFAKEWMDKILADHKELIEQDRVLYESLSKKEAQ